jgi:hypothetical protein
LNFISIVLIIRIKSIVVAGVEVVVDDSAIVKSETGTDDTRRRVAGIAEFLFALLTIVIKVLGNNDKV